jgi:hypothetical protein
VSVGVRSFSDGVSPFDDGSSVVASLMSNFPSANRWMRGRPVYTHSSLAKRVLILRVAARPRLLKSGDQA